MNRPRSGRASKLYADDELAFLRACDRLRGEKRRTLTLPETLGVAASLGLEFDRDEAERACEAYRLNRPKGKGGCLTLTEILNVARGLVNPGG